MPFSVRTTRVPRAPAHPKPLISSTVHGTTTATRGGKPVDLPDPHIHPDELKPDGTPAYAKKRNIAPLYEGKCTELDDVAQCFLQNCSYPASIVANL